MAYADYDWYKSHYLGNAIQEQDFPRLAVRASSYIDGMLRGRAISGDAVKNAACELAEIFQDEERLISVSSSTTGTVASETVGSWSRSYGSKSVSSVDVDMIERRKKDALRIHLPDMAGMRGQPIKKGWFP